MTTDRRGDLFDPDCPTRRLLDRIGTKWTSMAIKVLAESDEVRFAELRRRMPGRVHYRLTDLGRSLEVPLSAMRAWAEEHMAEINRAMTSATGDGL